MYDIQSYRSEYKFGEIADLLHRVFFMAVLPMISLKTRSTQVIAFISSQVLNINVLSAFYLYACSFLLH